MLMQPVKPCAFTRDWGELASALASLSQSAANGPFEVFVISTGKSFHSAHTRALLLLMPSSRDSSHHNQHSAVYSSIDSSLHDKHNHVVKMLGGHDYSLWLQLVARISARGIEAGCCQSWQQDKSTAVNPAVSSFCLQGIHAPHTGVCN